jgi:hypothetical protein
MTGHRHVRSIKPGEPLCEGFDKVGSHTKFLSDIIKMSDIGGEAAGRGCAMRNATLDWDAAATDATLVTRRGGCGGASQVAVGGVYGRSDRTLRVGVNKIRESSDLELGEC